MEAELANAHSLRHLVFKGYAILLSHRLAESAFHPTGRQEVVSIHPAVFALWRGGENGRSHLLCLHHVANATHQLNIPIPSPITHLQDLIGGKVFEVENGRLLSIKLSPYQIMWLKVI